MNSFRTNKRTISDFTQRANSFLSTASQKMDSNSNAGFPSLLSDEEFEGLQLRRDQGPRPEHDRLDNTGIRATPAKTDGLPESTIEQRFTHVSQQLVAMWPSDACALYIKRLVISDRGSRQGFPQEVVEDLMMLYQINEMRCRELGVNLTRSEDIPARSPYADATKAAFNWQFVAENKHKER